MSDGYHWRQFLGDSGAAFIEARIVDDEKGQVWGRFVIADWGHPVQLDFDICGFDDIDEVELVERSLSKLEAAVTGFTVEMRKRIARCRRDREQGGWVPDDVYPPTPTLPEPEP